MKKLSISKHPGYLLIQILRMEFRNGKTEKNSTSVDLFKSEILDIDKSKYKIIGIISHMGTAENGHNRAYIKKDSEWFLCEDSKPPVNQVPMDTPYEQTYCLLLRKCTIEEQANSFPLRDLRVVVKPLDVSETGKSFASAISKPKSNSKPDTPMPKKTVGMKRSTSIESMSSTDSKLNSNSKNILFHSNADIPKPKRSAGMKP